MSTQCVDIMKAQFDRAHSMIVQFVETCPEEVWKQTYGGFPVWQQAYHALACYGFFVCNDGDDFPGGLFGADEGDVIQFKKTPSAPAKDEVKKMAEAVKKGTDILLQKLDDAGLAQKHQGLSSRLSMGMTNLHVLTMLSSHTLYHLGGCDAALRGNGHPGIF